MNSSTANNHNEPSELEANFELLRDTLLFSGLPLETVKLVAYLAVRADFVRGEAVFRRGDDEGRAYLVLSGRLRAGDGDGPAFEVGEGELVGGLSLLGTMVRRHTLTALTDVRVLTIDRERFMKAVSQFPGYREWMVDAALRLVRHWEERLERAVVHDCPGCRQAMEMGLL